ncbi:transposase, partial [Escherichia coli]|uniref:transposase n=1 Tax=Escherichia coli TaxID=562 RepID=UPI001366053A
HHLMAFSDATIIDNPRHLRAAKKRLTRAQRALSRSKWRLPNGDLIDVPKRGQRVTPTTGRHKARARLAREHAAVAQHRASTLHAITKQLATSHAVVAVEDLNVAGMTRSARGTIDKPGRNVAAKAGLNRS